jgi:hypothetical protein
MSDGIVNKVAASGILTLDLEAYKPKGEFMSFDLKDHLFMGLILKEKDYREALKNLDWNIYKDKNVGVHCSADAIIPVWAYMLAASYLSEVATDVFAGTPEEHLKTKFYENLKALKGEEYLDKRIVIKGCGEEPIGDYAYLQVTQILRPFAKSIMYGEPCSTVPIYKKK